MSELVLILRASMKLSIDHMHTSQAAPAESGAGGLYLTNKCDNLPYAHLHDLLNGIVSAGKVDEKATQLHAIASLKVLLDATKPQANANDGSANGSAQTGTGGGGAPGSALADGDAHDSGRASQGTEVGR